MFNHSVFSVQFLSSFFFLALHNSLTDFSSGGCSCPCQEWNWMGFKAPSNSKNSGILIQQKPGMGNERFPTWDLCPYPSVQGAVTHPGGPVQPKGSSIAKKCQKVPHDPSPTSSAGQTSPTKHLCPCRAHLVRRTSKFPEIPSLGHPNSPKFHPCPWRDYFIGRTHKFPEILLY